MRILLPLFLLVAAAPAHPTVAWRPRAWHPPVVASAAGGLRVDPETGDAARELPDVASDVAKRRAALANVPVRRRGDGSRSAVVGGLARRWTVARVADDGRLEESCVTSEAAAKALVREGR